MSALEYELEYETEGEWEAELEGEEFLRAARRVARRVSPQVLRRVGGVAARSALSAGLGPLGGPASPAIAAGLGALGLRELEGELEEEFEAEEFVNPLRRVYRDALMEHLGHAAAEAESEAEAEAFIGALIPIAARLLPRVAPAVMRAAPGLIRGASGVARTLRANPATRPLVRAVPTIVRRTVADIARQAGGGRAVTPQRAVQTLARQTHRVLSSPHQCSRALQRNAVADRRYHRAARAQPNRVAV
jgi:hypothetical protein